MKMNYTFICVCLLGWVYTCVALNPYETAYFSLPNGTKAREYLEYYTSFPHIAGSDGDYATAVYTRDKFIEFGLSATIIPFQIYLNYPLSRAVRLVNDSTDIGEILFSANLTEPSVAVDPTSSDPNVIPTFNGYSASGNVTSTLVYANYGRYEDFIYLQSSGINITGKIVIVRYGQIFRGVKAMLAQKFGAAGLLIYSDPADDGFARGLVYPDGPWRPEDGVQRGSIQFLPICPGSPTDDRVAVCLGAENANKSSEGNLYPNIPVQPISWGDAFPLLQSLEGANAPSTWVGALNLTYKIGPSTTVVNVDLVMNFTMVTIWNVIANLSGQTSDEIVLLGNHRDAWVFGATDPNSGSASMLEIARSLATLQNTTGWVPKRDIIFCSWDAEEYGLIGSTMWGEANADDLKRRAIAYINTDVAVSGPRFGGSGTPSLTKLLADTIKELPYPGNPNITLYEAWNYTQLSVLGSGSDYTVFIDHLGIPSMDLGYSGAGEAGVYHSIYDSFYWMEKFGDPDFRFHQGLAQVLGILLMRISDSPSHPFNYTNYADQLSVYLAAAQRNVSQANFTPLQTAITQFSQAARAIDVQSACIRANSSNCTALINIASLNARLRFTERRMLINALTNSSDGLPGRPWYKHVIQAPGLYAGYGSQTFPGIAQGIIDNNWIEVQQQIQRAATAITDASFALTEVSANATTVLGRCFGDSNGSIVLTTTGGFTPLRFGIEINRSLIWQDSSTLRGLPSGLYGIVIMDSLNFTRNISVFLSQQFQLWATINIHQGIAYSSVGGGVPPYSYNWSTNSTATSTDLKFGYGVYSLTITDANECTYSTSIYYEPEHNSSSDQEFGKAIEAMIAVIVIGILVVMGVIAGCVVYWVRRRGHRQYQNL